ncbi:MAG TPA: SIR2 family protein [Cyclobacteriaceae bacterium]|nr:SIR2 family protein [Cyclobacteriaceae bacterium]
MQDGVHNIEVEQSKTYQSDWCKNDRHELFESFGDFNEWLDGDDGVETRVRYNLTCLSKPSRAFYAGDKQAYEQAYRDYRERRFAEVLSEDFIKEVYGDRHWYEINRERFEQLVIRILENQVIPFIGAGISVSAGFPTWKDHLRHQGRTAGIENQHIQDLLSKGEFENVIHEIETIRGREVFVQEIRDAFSKTPRLDDLTLRITELFQDTLITTNYDRTIETAFDTGRKGEMQIISGSDALQSPGLTRTTIYKIHGSIDKPASCIISKNQYDAAYGTKQVDLAKPIPKLLSYHYRTSSYLFLGCSLNNDRTMQVFKQIKEEIGDTDRPQHFAIEQAPETEKELSDRNAYLLRYGIVAIWFERSSYELVESLLRHLRNEVRYRNGGKTQEPKPNTLSPVSAKKERADIYKILADILKTFGRFKNA